LTGATDVGALTSDLLLHDANASCGAFLSDTGMILRSRRPGDETGCDLIAWIRLTREMAERP